MEVESVLAIKRSRLMGKPMSRHMKSWNEIQPHSTIVRISTRMAWMTNKQTTPPHVDVMIAWFLRRVLVNFSTHNSLCDRSKGDLGADFAGPRCDPQVKGSVTGNERETRGRGFTVTARAHGKSRDATQKLTSASRRHSPKVTLTQEFRTLKHSLLFQSRAGLPRRQRCFRRGHLESDTECWVDRFLARRESVARRLGARGCPLPSSKGSCVVTELWSPSEPRLFLACVVSAVTAELAG